MGETFRIEIPIEVEDNTEPELSKATKKLSAFEKSMKRTEEQLDKMKNSKVELALSAVDKASSVINKVKKNAASFAGKAWKTTISVVDKATAPLKGIFDMLTNPILQAGAVLGVSIGITDSINTFKDFEAVMSQVKAISSATSDEMELLTAKAKEMGAATKFTATEAGEAFNYMAMAGWEAEDMLSGIEGILSLAAASGTDLATTSDIVTDALTAFGLAASDAGHFSDVLAIASSSANTTVSWMGETFKYAGAMAGALGYSIEDVALATGLMANAGIKSSMAGTALNSIMTRLSTNVDGARESIEELGVNFYNSDGSARAFADVLNELRIATQDYTQKQKINLANTIAGTEAQKGLLAILNASESDYNKLTLAINNADGAAASMAETMQDNLAGSLELLQSAVDEAKLRLGERLSPYVREFADWLTDAMPQVNVAIDEMMDFVDEKIENLRNKIGDMTSGTEWRNADFFGKIEIAWDKIIAEPFSEWWNISGKAMMAEKAEEIGKGIGTGISSGILALLGINIDGAVEDGASVGAAFGKGLADGFDTQGIKEKFGEVLKSLFSNAADVLPGGNTSNLSSWLSAALIAKVGSGIIGAGLKGINLGKTMMGADSDSILKSIMGNYSVAGEIAGTGLAGGSGILGMLGKLGIAMGTGGTTSAGIVAAGGASLAGGIAGSAALISGIKDLSIALREDTDVMKSQAYGKSGTNKILGAGAGAMAGALIGSAVPVIGTGIGALVGAGIGGVAGWISGKKEVEEYEDAVTKAAIAEQEAALKAALATEQAKYASQELKDALASGISDSEFAYLLQRVESENLASHFGNITLSMEEIKTLAQEIAIPKEAISGLKTFVNASQIAENSLENFKNSVTTMEKLNWKAGLRFEMDDAGIENYKAGIDEMVSSAKSYLESKNFETDMALKLLVNEGDPSGIIKGVDDMYQKIQEELEGIEKELKAEVNIALEDGKIDADEQKIIENIQQKVADITEKISNAEMEAKMEMLNIKYGGAQLDYDSFSQLQQELASQVQSYSAQYEEALTVSITALNLELSEDAISQEDYDAAIKEIKDNYNASIDNIQVSVENFQLEAIANAYSDALEGLMPELQGTTAEKLSVGLHNAIVSGIDATEWTGDTVKQILGLENLQTEAADEIASLMSMVAATIPQKTIEAVQEASDPEAVKAAVREMVKQGTLEGTEEIDASAAGQAISYEIAESVSNADTTGMSSAAQTLLNNTFGNIDTSESADKVLNNFASDIVSTESTAVAQALGDTINNGVEDLDLTPTAESVMTNLTNSLTEADYTEIGDILLNGMLEYFEEADFTELGETLTSNISNSLTSEENLALLESAVQTVATATDTYLNNEFTINVGNNAGNDVPGNIGQSLDRSKENVHPGCDAVVSEVDSYLTGQLNSLTINASPTVNITPNYVVSGNVPNLTAGLNIGRNAAGGIVSGKQLSWVAEEGPEVIIPTVPSRRTRALELYEKAGQLLGVDKHAEGGIVGMSENAIPANLPAPLNEKSGSKESNKVVVEMSVNPSINISAGNETNADDIRKIVERTIRNMIGDISDEMSRKLARQFSNMGLV